MGRFQSILPAVIAIAFGIGSAYHTFDPVYKDLAADKFKKDHQPPSPEPNTDSSKTTPPTSNTASQTQQPTTFVRKVHGWWISKNPPS